MFLSSQVGIADVSLINKRLQRDRSLGHPRSGNRATRDGRPITNSASDILGQTLTIGAGLAVPRLGGIGEKPALYQNCRDSGLTQNEITSPPHPAVRRIGVADKVVMNR